MTLIGRASLLVEGQRAAGVTAPPAPPVAPARLMNFQKAGLIGGFLIGMSTFQGEFDFGVPQFQLVFHPMLIAFAAGIALVTARIWGGSLGGADRGWLLPGHPRPRRGLRRSR